MKLALASLACAFALHVSTLPGGDADWPQWRGPNRDAHAAPQKLLGQWPEGGPNLKWQINSIGRGYSTVSIVGNNIYTMGSRDGDCYAICLNATSGEIIWETRFSSAGTDDDYNANWGAGPRSTPTVDGEQVFVLSDVGVLAALKRENGDLIWSTSLVKDQQGEVPPWGYSESPLVDGDRVVVTPGGENFMIAVDRDSGERVWRSTGVSAPAQYVSVMRGQAGEKSFYVTASKPGLYAFDVDSGENLFKDSTTGNGTAVIPTPILAGMFLYHTSAYGAGNTFLKLKSSEDGIDAESIYHLSGKSMENHHGGCVLVDGVIYGFTKANGGNWMAQDLASGQTLWEQRLRPNKSGSICYADGRLYCYNDQDGTLLLVEPNRAEFIQKGELTISPQTELPRGRGAIWTHPVIANQTLYIRDQNLLFAYDIAK